MKSAIRDLVAAFWEGNPSIKDWTEAIERRAADVRERILSPDSATIDATLHLDAYRLLREIEKWKADCARDRMGKAGTNPPGAAFSAIQHALQAGDDLGAFAAITELRGFGSSVAVVAERPAKVASAVLRFLSPERFGVVDWRIAVVRGLFEKHDGVVEDVIASGRSVRREDIDKTEIDVDGAIDFQKWFRARASAEAIRAADVDMALFGLSLRIWPMKSERR